MWRPGDSPLLADAATLIAPKLVDFGVHLFGERLHWLLKEMWVNIMDTGGRQAMHNHANSLASGVIYLTPTHLGSRTMFMKSPGGRPTKDSAASSNGHRCGVLCRSNVAAARVTVCYENSRWRSAPPVHGAPEEDFRCVTIYLVSRP
ncbi:MAG: putative 2OG-Fe(II) oxygenase [Pseudomonadota bacterium]